MEKKGKLTGKFNKQSLKSGIKAAAVLTAAGLAATAIPVLAVPAAIGGAQMLADAKQKNQPPKPQ